MLFNTLEAYLRAREQQHQFSGVVLVTQGDATVWSGAYGEASRAWRAPNTLDTRFDTASITKLFTAVAALQLVDLGQLALDTRVVERLGLEGTTISPEVTVRQLLTHSSGIGDDADEESGESYEALWQTRTSYLVRTTADFLPQFIHKPPNFPPGQGCRYCNVGYLLVGLLIEQASSLPYRDYVRQHIFAPAGMAHTDFFAMDRAHPNVAEGADPLRDETGTVTGWKRNIYSFPPIGSPDAGAQVTAGDLDRFIRQVKAGHLMSPALTKAFLTPQVHYRTYDEHDEWWSYGLSFDVDKQGEIVSYQKEGINAGVSGMLRHYPAPDVNVIVLSNMEDGAWAPMREIHRMVVDETGEK
jgi:CubicO group peptidase (beta-lactamase class C family)